MSTVFIVTREGIYRHGVCGVWSDLKKAIECADHFARIDVDAYHTYEVRDFTLDVNTEHGVPPFYGSPSILEADPVYAVEKNSKSREGIKRTIK